MEVLDYLSGHGPYADREHYPFPSLLLLDLSMPVLTGFEVLDWLRTQPQLPRLPVIVHSSSKFAPDIQKAIELGADEYRLKPEGIDALAAMLKELHSRWLSDAAP